MRRRDLDISVPPPRLVDPRGVGGLNTSRERSYRIYAFVRGHGETGIAESSASIPFWVGAQKECHTAKPGEQCFRPGVPHCFTYLLYPRKFLIVEGCALVPPRQFIRTSGGSWALPGVVFSGLGGGSWAVLEASWGLLKASWCLGVVLKVS